MLLEQKILEMTSREAAPRHSITERNLSHGLTNNPPQLTQVVHSGVTTSWLEAFQMAKRELLSVS